MKATPGIAIVTLIEDKTSPGITTTTKKEGRIIKGKIVSMGEYDTTPTGEKIYPERFGKEGDIVHFLHYAEEGGVDIGMIDGIKYFFVKWGDFRENSNL